MYYDVREIPSDIKAEIKILFLQLEIETKEDIKKTIKELFVDLKRKKMLKINLQSQETFSIMHRMLDSLMIIMKYQQIVKNSLESNHYANMNEKWFKKEQIELIISNLYIQHLLENIEYGRNLLKNALDVKETNTIIDKLNDKKFKKHVDDVTTLPYIVCFFSKLFKNPKYEKILYNPLRNPFAHNNYFWKNDKLAYIDKKCVEQEISFHDMTKLIAETIFVVKCIYDEIKNACIKYS